MMKVIANFGSMDVLSVTLPLFIAWLVISRQHRLAWSFSIGVLIVLAVTLTLKDLFATPGHTVWPRGAWISQYFPSGHAAIAAAVYMSLGVMLRNAGNGTWRWAFPVTLAVVLSVGLSRVVTFTHPLGDVVAGLAIGATAPLLTQYAARREIGQMPPPTAILFAFLVAFLVGWLLPAPIHTLMPTWV
jgi:undecaprenyl-diphosphatase